MERAQRTHSCTTHMQPLVQWRKWGSITRASDVAGLFSCKQEGTQTQHSAIYTHMQLNALRLAVHCHQTKPHAMQRRVAV